MFSFCFFSLCNRSICVKILCKKDFCVKHILIFCTKIEPMKDLHGKSDTEDEDTIDDDLDWLIQSSEEDKNNDVQY